MSLKELEYDLVIAGAYVWQWDSPHTRDTAGGFAHRDICVNTHTGAIVCVTKHTHYTHDASVCVLQYADCFVLPGLQDTHLHVEYSAQCMHTLDLHTHDTKGDVLRALKTYVCMCPHTHWVVGAGWGQQKDTHTHTHTHTQPHTDSHTDLHTDTHTETHIHTPAHTHTDLHTDTHTHADAHTHTDTHTHTDAHAHTDPCDFISRKDIDEVVPHKPVILYRSCRHMAVVNTCAFDVCGLDIHTPTRWCEIPNGRVYRYADGTPSGMLGEQAIWKLIYPHVSNYSTHERAEMILKYLHTLRRMGITAVHTNDMNALHIYAHLAQQKKLPVRVYLTMMFEDFTKLKSQSIESNLSILKILEDMGLRATKECASHGAFISCGRVKIFADGSLGSKTAAISIPYIKDGRRCCDDAYGELLTPKEKLLPMLEDIFRNKLRVEIHTIGDRSVEAVLDSLDEIKIEKLKTVLTHCQFLTHSLIGRMKQHKVIASVQPSFVPSDAHTVNTCVCVKEKQHILLYPWKTLLECGVICTGGSDAPVEVPCPLKGIYDAIHRPTKHTHTHNSFTHTHTHTHTHNTPTHTRKDECQDPQEVAFDSHNECLDVSEALWLYTRGAALAANDTHTFTGDITQGYMADLTIIDRDISADPHRNILDAKVIDTFVHGKCINTHIE